MTKPADKVIIAETYQLSDSRNGLKPQKKVSSVESINGIEKIKVDLNHLNHVVKALSCGGYQKECYEEIWEGLNELAEDKQTTLDFVKSKVVMSNLANKYLELFYRAYKSPELIEKQRKEYSAKNHIEFNPADLEELVIESFDVDDIEHTPIADELSQFEAAQREIDKLRAPYLVKMIKVKMDLNNALPEDYKLTKKVINAEFKEDTVLDDELIEQTVKRYSKALFNSIKETNCSNTDQIFSEEINKLKDGLKITQAYFNKLNLIYADYSKQEEFLAPYENLLVSGFVLNNLDKKNVEVFKSDLSKAYTKYLDKHEKDDVKLYSKDGNAYLNMNKKQIKLNVGPNFIKALGFVI